MSRLNVRKRIIIKSHDPYYEFDTKGYKKNGEKIRTRLKNYLNKLDNNEQETNRRNKMKKFIRWSIDFSRMGYLDGLAIVDDDLLAEERSNNREVYLGEVLGKHSEIYFDFDQIRINVLSEDQEFINKLLNVIGMSYEQYTIISGYDIFYLEEDDEYHLDKEIEG